MKLILKGHSKYVIRIALFVMAGLLLATYIYRKNEFRYRLIYRFDDYVIYYLNKDALPDNLENSKKLDRLIKQIILDERYDPASSTLKLIDLKIDFFQEEKKSIGKLKSSRKFQPYLVVNVNIRPNDIYRASFYYKNKKSLKESFLFSKEYSLANKLPPQKFDFKDGVSYSINENLVSLTIRTDRQHSCASIQKKVQFYLQKGKKTFDKYDRINIELEGGLNKQSFILDKLNPTTYVISSVDWPVACHDTFRVESLPNGE